MIRFLFVCMGNICRSPTVEAIARAEFARADIDAEFASAGTEDYHVGQGADARSIEVAARHGYALETHRARQLERADFGRYDAILAMDATNLRVIEALRPADSRCTVGLFLDYAGIGAHGVPDPYYGGDEDFQQVVELTRQGVRSWIAKLNASTREADR